MRGVILVLLAAMLWGTTGTTQALAPASATPLAIGAIRLLVGGAALLSVAILRNGLRILIGWPVSTLLVASICMAAYQPFFFAGVARTGVAVGTIVTIGSAPVMTGALGYLFGRVSPGRHWIVATAVSLSGCVLLIFTGGSLVFNPVGVLFALGAGLAYAGFAVASKNLLAYRPPVVVMAVVFSLAAIMLGLALPFVNLEWLVEPGGWVVAAHLGLGTVALAYVLFAYGLRSISAATATTITLAEPATATALALILLGERLTLQALLGVSLVGVGLVILSMKPGILPSKKQV